MPQPDSGDNCCDCPSRASPCDDCGGSTVCCDPDAATISITFVGPITTCPPWSAVDPLTGTFGIPNLSSGNWLLGDGPLVTSGGDPVHSSISVQCSDGLLTVSLEVSAQPFFFYIGDPVATIVSQNVDCSGGNVGFGGTASIVCPTCTDCSFAGLFPPGCTDGDGNCWTGPENCDGTCQGTMVACDSKWLNLTEYCIVCPDNTTTECSTVVTNPVTCEQVVTGNCDACDGTTQSVSNQAFHCPELSPPP